MAGPLNNVDPGLLADGRQSANAAMIQRGTCRLLAMHGFAGLFELPLASNRRADVVALGRNSEIWIVEIKSSVADFRVDQKWPDYLHYCDRFFFATHAEVPLDIFPADAGLILADHYGGEIVRDAPESKLDAARRKAMLLRFARAAAQRLHGLADPGFKLEPDF